MLPYWVNYSSIVYILQSKKNNNYRFNWIIVHICVYSYKLSITEPIKLFLLLKSLQNDFIIKYHQILIDAYILTNSLAPYRFYDFVDQSTKLGTLTPYDVLSSFRRGATWKPHGILWFCPTVKPPVKLKPIINVIWNTQCS